MDERADRLRQARINAGFEKAVEAAERFGWSANTYKSNENGNAPFSFNKAKDYAKAFGVRAEWLYSGDGDATTENGAPAQALLAVNAPGDPVNLADLRAYIDARQRTAPSAMPRLRRIDRRVPVVGEVAAGIWKEAPVRQLEDVTEYLNLDVTGYERAELRAFKIVGPSMNLVYPDGRFVVTAHPAEAGLRFGDYVVVERSRTDLVEVTLKEFVSENGRLALWPRSTHPDFQQPLYLKDPDEVEQVGITIIGVVVADYSKRDRPPIPFERRA